MYNDSFNFTPSDGDRDEFEFDKHFYKRGAELTTYTLNWYADWATISLLRSVTPTMKSTFCRRQSRVWISVKCNELDEVDVYLGQDDNRQANDLDWEVEQLVARGTYRMDDHTVTFGYERDTSDIFNLFYQHIDTEIRFDGIDNFEDFRVYYGNLTNNELDAAVEWGYTINTAYIKQWQVNPDLRVTYGLRYDYYESDDTPSLNIDFVADYGFPNTATLDGWIS